MNYEDDVIEDLETSDLVVDAIYASGSKGIGKANEVIHRLLPGISNSGGFRTAKKGANGRVVVLFSSTRHPDWPDELDPYRGTYTYFGDNRTPGKSLHDTSRSGNKTLREAFELSSGNATDRQQSPVFLVFEKANEKGFDIKFRGLAVPGTPENRARSTDLVAIWRTYGGKRFQNYKATFTILDCPVIDGRWMREVITGSATLNDDLRVPAALNDWFNEGKYTPLTSQEVRKGRSRDLQLPATKTGEEVIACIRSFCGEDNHFFEAVAAKIWEMSAAEPIEYQLTQRSRDGGRDATGDFFIGPNSDRIRLSFVLEAKNYSPTNSVGVKEMARLISRIRHREFGVIVTTSYVADQAYHEVRSDEHPIVIISGRDIVEILARNQITTTVDCVNWLRTLVDPR